MEQIAYDQSGRLIIERGGQYFVSRKPVMAECLDCGRPIARGMDWCASCAEGYGFLAEDR